MSERIKRYDLDIKVNIDIQDGELTAPPTASKTEVESPTGRFCLSTDVAALEAENARLRRIVEAAEEYVEALNNLGATYRVSSRPSNQLLDRLNRAKSAYDAAKEHATQQGEKKP